MILDIDKFVRERSDAWEQYEKLLTRMENAPNKRLSIEEAQSFYRLHQQAASDLAKLESYASDPATIKRLEGLVARGYGEMHDNEGRPAVRMFRLWFMQTFPLVIRRHISSLYFVMAVFFAGSLFGGLAVMLDPDSKDVIMPFSHLLGDPSERVADEEASLGKDLEGGKTYFSAYLMTNNIKVSIFAMALGMTFGVGTIVILFYNGVIIGAVVMDYLLAGEWIFLLGWLLPHGSVEIPSILLAGQAGLVLGKALLFKDGRKPMRSRLKDVRSDLITLIAGVAILLVWAGLVEAFLSQYHEPIIPYSVKIVFGLAQLTALIAFIVFGGRKVSST
ncbi:stage II sporulation protein M [Rubellicoccus peritrichatus]|uniref:Stage II sporulation protein M n=1 Tax=Rubellicoccus peritrichatus TaxID=3080537 RepID=A0AAQ3LDZ7_9BACT|nr:stage II sporulation protein M [Puniceicoccus sp. CR14]WOO42175.1 stage II sporulation protein M [Puniceicoccus sp. CR14]